MPLVMSYIHKRMALFYILLIKVMVCKSKRQNSQRPFQRWNNVVSASDINVDSTLKQRWNKVAFEIWGNVKNVALFQRQYSTFIQGWNRDMKQRMYVNT